jgi:hypothetical protein
VSDANPSERAALALTEIQSTLIDQLVEAYAQRFGETPEQARRAVEIGIITRGIRALQEESKA